jgi:hypothetical protein
MTSTGKETLMGKVLKQVSTVSFDASITASGVLLANEKYRAVATEDCHFEIGRTADVITTTASDYYLPKNVFTEFETNQSGLCIEVLGDSTSGVLFLTRLE